MAWYKTSLFSECQKDEWTKMMKLKYKVVMKVGIESCIYEVEGRFEELVNESIKEG